MPAAYYKTPIGFVRITEEEGFITSVYMLDGEFDMQLPETPLLKKALQQLDEYFKGDRRVFDLPLKQNGSGFQQQVWEQLSKIEYGKTISYLEQSKLMNNPLCIRAIASANGKNHLIIVVPCHRVIGSDGSLIGFGAGLWRKKWLLEHEAKVLGIGQTKLDF
ncbi:MAG TPA: methylated-DNA--[protein]-cysteine S-methyltransferase [Mucilaginibacter sp.]|jgi:methylated-DNA-[protein]-cysteine S-methyltransferase|nr:methylated-DNA--[protein]-cysteine S-methyltransferase [Mucilaginibacter sp.]